MIVTLTEIVVAAVENVVEVVIKVAIKHYYHSISVSCVLVIILMAIHELSHSILTTTL